MLIREAGMVKDRVDALTCVVNSADSVGCSTAPFKGNSGCRSTSVPTTIHSTGSNSGMPIYGYWR